MRRSEGRAGRAGPPLDRGPAPALRWGNDRPLANSRAHPGEDGRVDRQGSRRARTVPRTRLRARRRGRVGPGRRIFATSRSRPFGRGSGRGGGRQLRQRDFGLHRLERARIGVPSSRARGLQLAGGPRSVAGGNAVPQVYHGARGKQERGDRRGPFAPPPRHGCARSRDFRSQRKGKAGRARTRCAAHRSPNA